MDHVDHVVKLVGPDHVGLGSDFDGATMPVGMEDVAQLPKITEALLRRNYPEVDIKKILGENTLRLMADVERISAEICRVHCVEHDPARTHETLDHQINFTAN